MAVITAVNWESALGITGAGTPYSTAAEKPLFEAGQTVFRLSDFPTSGSGNVATIPTTEYTISAVCLRVALDGSSDTQILDQLELATSPCDMTTSRAVAGWQHTTIPAGTTGASTTSNAFFYNIADSVGNIIAQIHQNQLTNVAGAETYVAAEAAGWIG